MTGISHNFEPLTACCSRDWSLLRRMGRRPRLLNDSARDFKRGQPAENLKPLALMCHLACYSDRRHGGGYVWQFADVSARRPCAWVGAVGVEIDKKLFSQRARE